MRKIFFLSLVAFIVVASCKKTTTEPNSPPPPPVTDTTKQEKPDTTYLQKTDIYYHYDPSGTNIVDSNLTSWSYDNKRRVTTKIFNSSDSRDTTFSSYSTSKNVFRTVAYINGVLISDFTETYFLNASGKPDSLGIHQYFLAVNNGVEMPQYYNRIRYYYYNTEGNDTAEQEYSIDDNNIRTATTSASLTYTGSDLDSIIYYDHTAVNSMINYENGNLIEIKGFLPNGTLFSDATFTYYDILSGGFFGYAGSWQNRQLTKSMTLNFPTSPGNNVVETDTYTFDSSNRVKTLTGIQNNILSWKREYTYY